MSGSSTGQILGYVVGAVVGFFTGGVGWALAGNILSGAAAGGAIGGMLDPPAGPTIVGPRLGDLTVQTSTYGSNIPHIHGTVATMGNVFALEGDQLKETPHKKKSGGKGGGGSKQKTWTYSATFALGLCDTRITGPIAGVRRIWVAGKLFYDAGSDDIETIIASNQAAATFAVYLGTEDQMPDPRLQADKGVANTPAYRGLAYIVFYDLQLDEYGNSLMGAPVKVEVVSLANSAGVCPVFTALDEALPTNRGGRCLSVLHDNGTLLVGQAISNQIIVTRRTLRGETLVIEDVIGSFLVDGITYYPSTPSNNNPYSYYATRGDGKGIVVNNGVPCPLEKWTYKTAICDLGGVTYAVHDGAVRGFANGVVVYEFAISGPDTEVHCGLSTDGEYLYVQPQGSGSPVNPEMEPGTTWLYEMTPDLTVVQKWPIGQLSNLSQGGIALWPISRRKLAGTVGDEPFRIYTLHDDGTFTASCETSGSVVVAGSVGLPVLYQPDRFFVDVEFDPISPEKPLLSDIVSTEMLQSGVLLSGDIDVSALTNEVRGYRVTQTGAVRAAIEPLQAAWPFDVIQSGYQIKAVTRGNGSVATIDASLLDARGVGEAPGPQITIVREMDTQLPRRVSLKHLDVSREYDMGEQYAERTSGDSISLRELEMPIVLTSGEAAGKAEVLLYLYWLERHTISFKLPPEFLGLEPADVITITAPSASYELRITNINYLTDQRLECVARYNSAAIYTPAALGEDPVIVTQTLGLPGPSAYELLDIPAVSSEMDEPVFLAAMTGYTASWPGGVLVRSSDGGQTWDDLQGWSGKCTMGRARNTTGEKPSSVVDAASVLQVDIISGELESITELAMLNGGNHFAYGSPGRWEIMAARTITLQGDGSYLLQDMLRGRFGTEHNTGNHAVADAIVLLNDVDNVLIGVDSSTIGLSRLYRGITMGRQIDSDSDHSFTYNAVNLECLSPVYLNGNRHPSTNDWTLTWIPRTRIGGEWRDLVDAPISEATEAYEVDIFSDGTYTTVSRTLTSSTPTVAYTSAQQVTDFGSNQATLYVRVYMMSATVGRGFPLQTSITR